MKKTILILLFELIFITVHALPSLPLPFLSGKPGGDFFQEQSEFNKIKLSDFTRISDMGYSIRANVYFGGQINHSSGYGNYHLGTVWRNINKNLSISSQFYADLEHNIPATFEFRIEEYRIELNIWIFIIPIVLVSVFSLITVVYQSIKAAKDNPANSLRYE